MIPSYLISSWTFSEVTTVLILKRTLEFAGEKIHGERLRRGSLRPLSQIASHAYGVS
jgi:hypothetical protein